MTTTRTSSIVIAPLAFVVVMGTLAAVLFILALVSAGGLRWPCAITGAVIAWMVWDIFQELRRESAAPPEA